MLRLLFSLIFSGGGSGGGGSSDRKRRTTNRYGQPGSFRKPRGVDTAKRGLNGKFFK